MIIMASLHSDQAARFLRLLAASSAVLVALLCAAPGLAQETCTSAQCHAGLVAAANVHAAADSCDSCHEALGEPHPQKGKRTFKLTESRRPSAPTATTRSARRSRCIHRSAKGCAPPATIPTRPRKPSS